MICFKTARWRLGGRADLIQDFVSSLTLFRQINNFGAPGNPVDLSPFRKITQDGSAGNDL
jgi:hypothetical protein